jgi:hypothetical protein
MSGPVIFSIYWVLNDKHEIKAALTAAAISGTPTFFAISSLHLPNTENFLRNASNYLELFLLMTILLLQIANSSREEKEKEIN